jgi:hypothetical protein
MLKWGGEYLFHGLWPEGGVADHKRRVLLKLIGAIRGVLDGVSTYDNDNREDMDSLKLQVVEALVACEGFLPVTEQSVLFHVFVHLPDVMYRWNNPRNYWSFFGERCINNVVFHFSLTRCLHPRDNMCQQLSTDAWASSFDTCTTVTWQSRASLVPSASLPWSSRLPREPWTHSSSD